MEVVVLRKKRRILLEEIHRQFLEGECEPKKRLKSLNDIKKKKPANATAGAPPTNSGQIKQQDSKQEVVGN